MAELSEEALSEMRTKRPKLVLHNEQYEESVDAEKDEVDKE